MTELNRAGQPASLGHIDSTQKDFRSQIDALTDTVRQLGGKPTLPADPLSAPYVLYVDSYIGSDTFVSGDYNASLDDGTFDSKMKRISLQRLECGYTQSRPFRTLSRAVIEAGIITSRDYLDLKPAPCGDLVTIVLSSGIHTLLNSPGDASAVSEWTDGFNPTDADLTAFSGSTGGLILPRGCSVVSLDLRKTIVRPSYVPASADEAADLSNRSAMFLLTGGCYLYGFTIMDKEGLESSHHLLSGFGFAGKTELDRFYTKIRTAFDGSGATGNIDPTLAVSRSSEYFIVGAQTRLPAEGTDTVRSSSPYIYNISMRSEYGMSGMIADGSLAGGSFKSMVVAQYTGVSLQRDLSCWEKYDRGVWGTFSDYTDLINSDPDNVRYKPGKKHFHVRTRNGAIIQEVSVFAIGHATHHFAESGSQITITNSNSNFGGCAAIADGFQAEAAPGDAPFLINAIRRAVNPLDKTSNIKRLYLGLLEDGQTNSATTLDMQTDLTASIDDPTQPDLLVREGYTLKENDYIWVENPGGPDYRAQLAATPWDPTNPDKIRIKTRVETDNVANNVNPDDPNTDDNVIVDIKGQRVYVRRFLDVRTVAERRYSILNDAGLNKVRLPVRDYVIQPTTGSDWTDSIQAVAGSENNTEATNGAVVELRYSKRPAGDTTFSSNVYYRKADVVRRENKHWFAIRDSYGPWEDRDWQESYVHMEEEFAPEGYYTNAQPIISFNQDSDQSEDSKDLGNSLTDPLVVAQLRSGVDYLGTFYLLRNLGETANNAHNLLTPQSADSTDLDVSSKSWEVEYRRPTNIRLFGHAYEWSGYSNYSKGLPQYQGDLSPNNKFTYLFTNEAGGKVYASGFNEEGFLVTPRGIEDLTSGKVLGLEDIGNPDRPISYPTVFDSLKVKDTLDVSGAEIIGLQPAKLDTVGGAEIASLREIESAPVPANDASLEIPDTTTFITPKGLKYWASWAKVVTQREGVTILYVVPDNAAINGTYEWDYDGGTGTIGGTIALDPNRVIGDNPPLTREKACTFRRAVQYANSVFSATETVQYRLANGPYWEVGVGQTIYTGLVFDHVAQIVGASNKFPTSNVLSDFTAGATPTTNVKRLIDQEDIPRFAIRTGVTVSNNGGKRVNAYTYPLLLTLNEGGSINGIAWLGADATFADTASFPDSIFNPALVPYRGSMSTPQAVDAFFGSSAIPTGYAFERYYGGTQIKITDAKLNIRNVIFGAKAPGLGTIGYGGTNPIIDAQGKSSLNLSNVYLLGNTIATSFPLHEAKGTVVSRFVYGVRNSQEFIGGKNGNSKASELTIFFPSVKGINSVDAKAEYDLDVNCIHLLDNNGQYATVADRNATNGTAGPGFYSLIGSLPKGSKVYTGGYSSYQNYWVIPNHHHGFAGAFCNDITDNQGPLGIHGADGAFPPALDSPISFYRNASYRPYVWQQARTGANLEGNIVVTPGPGQTQFSYDDSSSNPLNVRVKLFTTGIDVSSAQTIGQDFYG